MNQRLAELGKAHIAPAGDDVVGQMDDVLFQRLVAHFRAAEHDFDVWALRFEQFDEGAGWHHVPDIHPKPDDFGVDGQQFCGQFFGFTVDGELAQRRFWLQIPHVGQQIP